jgi:hypothetical protein
MTDGQILLLLIYLISEWKSSIWQEIPDDLLPVCCKDNANTSTIIARRKI